MLRLEIIRPPIHDHIVQKKELRKKKIENMNKFHVSDQLQQMKRLKDCFCQHQHLVG
jgi:hypothetical protein